METSAAHTITKSEKNLASGFFFLLLAALLSFQTLIYFEYNLEWVDTDQFFMWTGVYDFSNGFFNEPRYYGQNYNTFLEALIAVPFYKLGLHVYQALPLATNLIFLFPLITSAVLLFRAQKPWQAIAFLALILCMNPAYFLLNAQPRGFVTGFFFCAFYLQSFLKPDNKRWLFINSAAGVLAYFINPNSLLLTVPLFAYLFYTHYRKGWYWGLTALAGLLYLPLDYFFNHFYRQHPDYIKTDLIMEFGLRYLKENLSALNQTFAQLSFFSEQAAIGLLLTIALLLFFLFRHKRKAMLFAGVSFLLFLLISMTVSKTRDGGTWVYLSYSRMYLGIPLVLAFFISAVPLNFKTLCYLLIPAALIHLSFNFITQEQQLKTHFDEKNWNALYLIPLEKAIDASNFYGQKCKEQEVDFILVSHRFWAVNTICYGGKALDKNYPESMETVWDKRYKVRNMYENKVVAKFILLSTTSNIAEELAPERGFKITKLDDYGLALVTDNTLPLSEFIKLERQHEMPY